MADDLPSIASLQAFARAAELLSFKEAAEDLGVSPSALSRQIQGLEANLGAPLFRRLNPGLELTAEGRRYLESVQRVLRELRSGREVVAGKRSGPLRVSSLQSFTESWLIPRLADFEKAHPGIELEVEATLRYADFERDPVDVAIRFGTGPWGELHSEPIVDLEYFPVCSPSLRDGEPPLAAPADLARHTLIHIVQVPNAWRDWLHGVGLDELSAKRTVRYDHLSIALSAAEAGQGVALCAKFLCEQRLASGRLCVAFEVGCRSSETYHLVCRPESLGDPRVIALRDWLVESLAAV
jgi:LysR family transcriptional regulator, glycine cleavage system transcriptional activator